jgi:hypothetical protein
VRSAGTAVRRVGAVAAAALIVSSQCTHRVLGRDNALVFDHDQTLVGADFAGRTDLMNAIFSKSNCTRANFAGANLKNAQLDDTVLIEAVLDDAGIFLSTFHFRHVKAPHKRQSALHRSLFSRLRSAWVPSSSLSLYMIPFP